MDNSRLVCLYERVNELNCVNCEKTSGLIRPYLASLATNVKILNKMFLLFADIMMSKFMYRSLKSVRPCFSVCIIYIQLF